MRNFTVIIPVLFLFVMQSCTKEKLSNENYSRLVGKWGSICYENIEYRNEYFEIEKDGEVRVYNNGGTLTVDVKLGRIKYLRTESSNDSPIIKHIYKVKFTKKFCGPENKYLGDYNQLEHVNGSFDRNGIFIPMEQITLSDKGKEFGQITMPRKTW